ncbi:DUF6933 domain-containing protein [Gemmatimonadota bacterium]
MILRVTVKLGKKIKNIPEAALPLDANPFADWSSHLFTVERRQYILIANTASLYSVVMFGSGITDEKSFIRRMRLALRQLLSIEGYDRLYWTTIESERDSVVVSKTLNRSVTGSMNDLVYGAQHFLAGNERTLIEVSLLLNETPLSYLDSNPRDTFRSLTEQHFNHDDEGVEIEGEVKSGQSRRLPLNPLEWLEEIREAYNDARAAIPFGKLAKHSIDEQKLYHLAPSIAVKYRGLSADKEKLEQATNAAISSYMANIDVEREVLSDPRLAFACCYLASHYGLGLVGIATLEEVMAVMEFNREQLEVTDDLPEPPGIL